MTLLLCLWLIIIKGQGWKCEKIKKPGNWYNWKAWPALIFVAVHDVGNFLHKSQIACKLFVSSFKICKTKIVRLFKSVRNQDTFERDLLLNIRALNDSHTIINTKNLICEKIIFYFIFSMLIDWFKSTGKNRFCKSIWS